MSHNTQSVDLNGDGRDEFFYTYTHGLFTDQRVQALVLNSQTTGIIDQVNFIGRLGTPLFRDLDDDGELEALIPVTRNDSLFLTIVSAQGKKLSSLFLINGQPRVEPEGVMPWDIVLVDAAAADLDFDGSKELITVVNTQFARLPRGVLVHRLRDGALIGRAIVGAAVVNSIIEDFDGDGRPEVFASGAATNNGGEAGGFSDAHAYLMLFETWPKPRVKWHRQIPGTTTIVELARPDYDGDGRAEILLMAGQSTPSFLEILETRTWRTLRLRSIDQAIGYSVALDVDRDGRLDVVAPAPPHEILIFDDDLEIMTRTRVPMAILGTAGLLPDLDSDGIQEIVIGTTFHPNSHGFLLFGPRLNLKAAFIDGLPAGVLRTAASVAPPIIVQRPNQMSVLVKLARNRLFLVQRYGAPAALPAVVIAVTLAGLAFQRHRHRHRLLATLRGTLLDPSPEGLLLFDRNCKVAWLNITLARWCGAAADSATPSNVVSSINQLPARLSEFCRECLACNPPRQITMPEPWRIAAEGPLLTVLAEPVLAGMRGDPHWLIRVQDSGASSRELTAAWAPLARRTAHDLRNPLTSILLTLQRLQMEYRTAAPDIAPALDAYATRLQQRVDQLRRLASNFLKLLGAEKPHLEEHDLNVIVHESVADIRAGLPPDLRLEVKLADHPPHVVIDREQIESVLENLVANAINAMPAGGTITVSTHLARGLHLNAAHNGDCVQLEVLDTGTGIDPAALPRIFEPGFSTADHGSGLGLAIVKKIVDDHGGEVSVASEVGTGTAFTILLPVATAVPRVEIAAHAR